ncbi:DUF429 domain-containing protein [Haloferax prahovense]|uniref:DUF429 domain-containing protein n=1 Tax=Haloferax prahovense TaxID=381852 RepID=UPI0009DE0433|nr:DUF429 domain-containing protein [Haloferax prahovense]
MSTKVYGIDFSGSKSPSQKIWITEASLTDSSDQHLHVQDVSAAAELFSATHRSEVLTELRDLIRRSDAAVIGLDFPFSLSQSSISTEDWEDFLEGFASNFNNQDIDAYPGPYESDEESRRETDFRFGGQSPMSPQVRYQVFYGLRDVLHPLVTDDEVRVLPMQNRDSTKPSVLEVYPAATFGAERLYRIGYKENTKQSQDRRRVNAEGLQSHENLSIEDDLVEKAIQSDDALDSLCAAFAVSRAIREGLNREQKSVEGHIFA